MFLDPSFVRDPLFFIPGCALLLADVWFGGRLFIRLRREGEECRPLAVAAGCGVVAIFALFMMFRLIDF